MRIPVSIDFGGLTSAFNGLVLKPVASFHTDELFTSGFDLSNFAVDLDLTGIMNMILPPPGQVNATEDYLLVWVEVTAS